MNGSFLKATAVTTVAVWSLAAGAVTTSKKVSAKNLKASNRTSARTATRSARPTKVAAATTTSEASNTYSNSSTASFPAEPINTSVTTTAVATPKKKALPVSVGGSSWLYGTRVNDPGNAQVPDDSVGAITGIKTRHQYGVTYNINKKTAVTPVADFNFQITDPSPDKRLRNDFTWNDSFIRLSRAGIMEGKIKGNTLALDGDMRLFVPSSLGARQSNTIGGLRVSLNPSFQFAKSGFSISTANYARFWFQTQDNNPVTAGALPRWRFYTGPQLNYAFNDRVTAFALYEAVVTYDTKGTPDTRIPGYSNSDFEPGVDIRIFDRLSIAPYLNWYTNQKLSTTTLNLQANLLLL